MRSAVSLAFLASLVACGGNEAPGRRVCGLDSATASCTSGVVDLELGWDLGGTSRTQCDAPVASPVRQPCAQGCAVEGTETGDRFMDPVGWYTQAPEVLCKEAPEAKAGDACAYGTQPCLPTRAKLAADGTVIGQDYLACGYLSDNICHPAPAPAVPGYLTACDAATLQQYGAEGVIGAVADPKTGTAACLLAWDSAAKAITSGVTITCIGDWECPAGALCDDAIPRLSSTTAPAVAVCKPGPRGALTPAMLTR